MDAQSILTLIKIFVPVVIILAALNVYLFFRLKNIDLFEKWDANKINGALFLVFCVVGLILSFWGMAMYDDLYILIHNPASEQGEVIDEMFWITAALTLFVYVVTNFLLMYFAFKYSGSEGKKAYYYPENNKLEMWWTVIPAIVLTLLVFRGMYAWTQLNVPAPENAVQVEVTGKQFEWTIRYPGIDGKFGMVTWDSINDAKGNSHGYHFVSDKKTQDDFNPQEIHIPVGTPIKLNIRAKDVLHCASLPHFRMKMDAVPGMSTAFWFTPTKTTAEMRKIRNKPDFNYELACQEICGGGHWNMRRVVVVDTKEDYAKWVKEQKTTYAAWLEANAPAAPVAEAGKTATDSTKKAEPAKAKPEIKKTQASAEKKGTSGNS